MGKLSLLTPINYERPKSNAEKVLSKLSNYFYLGGSRATVIKGNGVRLDTGKIPRHIIALKVASYILFAPFTLTLLAVNLGLRHLHNFTIINSPQSKKTIREGDLLIHQKEPTIKTDEQTQAVVLSSSPKPELTGDAISQRTSLPTTHSTTVTAQNTEDVRQQVIPTSSSKDKSFQPFTIKISGESLPPISSLEEMRSKAREIGEQVLNNHIKLRIDFSSYVFEEKKQFIEELRRDVDVISTRWSDLFYAVPKRTEEVKENLTIRKYDNGVIEEVHSARTDWEYWEGRRIYPSGVIETGRFDDFCWHIGTRVETGLTTYRHPDTLAKNHGLDRGLIYLEEDKRLIVIHKKTDSAYDYEYVEIDEDPVITLTNLLKETYSDFRKASLKKILSGPINFEEFIQFLFKTNAIFDLQPYPLRTILKMMKEKGGAVNLRQEHPETHKTLLDSYLKDAKILKILLSIDSNLIQRKEGMESIFVNTLLKGNNDGAKILFTTMEEQKIPLLPRELLFKKVAFTEGEVSLEELKSLSLEDQEITYRLANSNSQLNVVRTLRSLGFGRHDELLKREGPSIFGCNMDALEMQESLNGFLTNLRTQKLLLTRSEFEKLPSGNYEPKGQDIGRILGRDYIERKAQELGLKHIKVPKKMMVVDDHTDQTFFIDTSLGIKALGDHIAVYAEKIQKAERKITAEEVSELLRLFEATGFCDIHWGNVIVAKDGVYIIDTEFTNFWVDRLYFKNGNQYAEMVKIVHALPLEEQQTLIDELKTKCVTYQKQEEDLNKQRGLRLKAERAALEKTGCFYGQFFTFFCR